MKTLRGVARFIARVLFAAVLTLAGTLVAVYVLISLGGEPVLDTPVGSTVAMVAMFAAFITVLVGLRDA